LPNFEKVAGIAFAVLGGGGGEDAGGGVNSYNAVAIATLFPIFNAKNTSYLIIIFF
jgi:hypothetical protein